MKEKSKSSTIQPVRLMLVLLLFLLNASLVYGQDTTSPPTIPIAWEIQFYNGFPPLQLWVSLETQPAEVVLAGGFHDTTFSPDRQWLAYIAHDNFPFGYAIHGDLVIEPYHLTTIPPTGLSADALGEPLKEDISESTRVSFIGLNWIDSERLLFNAMDTHNASFVRTNHMDLHLFNRQRNYGEAQHREIFGDGEGGWAIPSPTGQHVAVFNSQELIVLDGETLTPLQEPIRFERFDDSFSCGTSGFDYPDYEWSADGNALWFHIVGEEGVKKSCFLNMNTLALTCGEAIPRFRIPPAFSDNLGYVAYTPVFQGQIAIASHQQDGSLEEVVQIPESEGYLPVRWIDNQTLLYRKIIDFCTESEDPAPSHYFTYSLETGESTPWLEDRTIMAVQQINEAWFAVASGDCETVLVELINLDKNEYIQLAEMSHPNSIYWFRFVD